MLSITSVILTVQNYLELIIKLNVCCYYEFIIISKKLSRCLKIREDQF